ncbi:ribonuclease P protein component [Ralstonia syzygii subsp. celebesensis]|uniref:Ribonuclease P protein component n=3 Tax=Ralstonia solanacearum species complex TaxID=3116862 RepID=A0AAD0WHL7_RALSL|nr:MULTISPECIES: ribonuclease P protein component [Ralstonia solanacearum species complex]AMP39202.1 ribonuclease P protein component [Ralstonia solanacearum]AQW31533.1 ribonuclease P protein component [blood disease bacterium A2-HR MARDI]AXV78600.1 ribonuclease P protein component [Ralstonia solanacearum]AXV83240.1 ribonuclease P protein component [Ralstonia solanacearum]AXV88031.1 ribonuclease P protein component [Ralstonia solanacearum]
MGPHAFPKAARLVKTDEFSSVFALRPVRRSRHFVLYVRANGHPQARLGIVVGKKFARRAVERNLIKRQCRELFRLRQAALGGRDVLIRLQTKFPREDVPTVAAFKRLCREELSYLFEIAARPLPAPPPVPSPAAAPVPSDGAAP